MQNFELNNRLTNITRPQIEHGAKPVLRSCGMCDFYGETDASLCPKCEEPTLQNPAVVSVCGLIMALLGGFLVLFTGWIFSAVHEMINNRKPDPLAKYGVREPSGDPQILYFILSALIALGVVFTFTGLVQYYQERRNMKLINLSIKLTAAFFFICQLVMYFLR